jgi:hypothetical protein
MPRRSSRRSCSRYASVSVICCVPHSKNILYAIQYCQDCHVRSSFFQPLPEMETEVGRKDASEQRLFGFVMSQKLKVPSLKLEVIERCIIVMDGKNFKLSTTGLECVNHLGVTHLTRCRGEACLVPYGRKPLNCVTPTFLKSAPIRHKAETETFGRTPLFFVVKLRNSSGRLPTVALTPDPSPDRSYGTGRGEQRSPCGFSPLPWHRHG